MSSAYKMKNIIYAYIVIYIVSVSICLAPLGFNDQKSLISFSTTGIFGLTLRTSVTLRVFEGIGLGCALPMLADVFLDIPKISFMDFVSRLLSQFVCIVSAILYLTSYDLYSMAYLYIAFFGIKLLTVSSAILYSISRGAIATKWKIHPLVFITPVTFLAITNILVTFNILYPDDKTVQLFLSLSYGFVSISTLLLYLFWFITLWRQYRINKRLEYEETKEMFYMLGMVLFFISFEIVNLASKQTGNGWPSVGETSLIAYSIIYACCLIFLSVLPSRLLRTMTAVIQQIYSTVLLFTSYFCFFVCLNV